MPEFIYEGTEVLENLKEAVNYNDSLKDLVIKNSNAGRTLDFGAGIGTFSEMMKSELAPECLEVDEKQANFLEKIGFQVHRELNFNEEFDFIYSLNVLEHIEDHKGIAQDLIKSLKPGGRLLVFVPAFNILYSDLDKKVGHFRRYRISGLKALFEGSQTTVTKARYFDTIGFFFALVFKTLGLKTGSVNKRNITIFDKIFYPLNFVLDPLFSMLVGKNVYVIVEKK
jgi:SAM-dependent methyltransferase